MLYLQLSNALHAISVSKLTILPNIQPANRIVIISDVCFPFRMRVYPIFFTEFNSKAKHL